MKINYEKLNNAVDFFYTVGLAVIFMLAGIFLHSLIYNIVSVTYGVWVISLWINDYLKKRRENFIVAGDDCQLNDSNSQSKTNIASCVNI